MEWTWGPADTWKATQHFRQSIAASLPAQPKREEHLIPLMIASGAGGDAAGKRVFTDEPMGAQISAHRFD